MSSIPNVLATLVPLLLCLSASTSATGAVRETGASPQRDLQLESLSPATDLEGGVGGGFALIIGVDGVSSLTGGRRFAQDDGEAVYAALISPEGGNFRAENVHKLIGIRATPERVRSELAWLSASAARVDRVLIYYAGYGLIESPDGSYLALYGTDPERLAQTALPIETLGTALDNTSARWKVVMADALHNGALRNGLAPATTAGSLFVFTSGRDRDRSNEGEQWGGGHGVFTYHLVRALGGAADDSRDGIVTADEVSRYVRINVRSETGQAQSPTSDGPGFDPETLLAYVPSNVLPEVRPDPEFATLIIASESGDVELIVDGRREGTAGPGRVFRLPGLRPGVHNLRAVRSGYESFGPLERMLHPGEQLTIHVPALGPARSDPDAARDFDEGFQDYQSGDYRLAANRFARALDRDTGYAKAADFLARSYHYVRDYAASRQYFERALDLDPGAVETRARFAGMLMDVGENDEAIRQLNGAIQRQPGHAVAHYLLSEAFRRKEDYVQSVVHGRRSIALEPELAEAHFWLAEGLRMSGDYAEARMEYDEYLRLSDFDSGWTGDLNYWFLGLLIGRGERTSGSREDVWEELRRDAYFGLCNADFRLRDFDEATAHCRKAVSYDRAHAYSHYLLGLIYAERSNQVASDLEAAELMAAALQRFEAMLEINPYMEPEADNARQTIAHITEYLSSR